MKLHDEPFRCYVAKQSEINDAWSVCEQRFASLPSPLREQATQFLDSIRDPSGSYRSYFSSALAPPLLYMPLWLCEGLSREHVMPNDLADRLRLLLAGTIQGYLAIRIQDDVLDDRERSDPSMLLFANACLSGMTSAYVQAVGSNAATFWTAFDRAFVDFSRHTLSEQRAVRTDAPYLVEAFDEHADKVAFARIPLLAAANMMNRCDVEPGIGALVHRLGIAYGLVNDVIGWPRDVRSGHRTYLLARAGLTHAELDQIRALDDAPQRARAQEALVTKLRGALYANKLLHGTMLRAIELQRQAADTAQSLGLAHFDDYTHERIAWLETLDRQLTTLGLMHVLSTARAES